MPPSEARCQARLKFGAIEAAKDAHRDARGIVWLEALVYDIRFATRTLKRERAFAAILLLALAVGANVTAFRVMDTIGLSRLLTSRPTVTG